MNNKSITPNPQQPVDRVPTGQLPSALAELGEASLCSSDLLTGFGASGMLVGPSVKGLGRGTGGNCSYDGDDE
jgi:bacteriocin leader peptide (microcyclamide/patellamide family)